MKKLIILITLLSMSGCVSLNSVSLTPIPTERDQKVFVQQDKFIFLGFNFDNDFIDSVTNDLKRQCPNGKVTGLLTKDEDINYFLYIFWKKQITASGYCVKNISASSQNKNKTRGTASEASTSTEDEL